MALGETVSVSVRVPRDYVVELERLANRDFESCSSLIRRFVRLGIDAERQRSIEAVQAQAAQ